MSVTYVDPHIRRRTVLVAVLNNPRDLHRAAAEGWYRIPQRHAPSRIGADYLAFYQTGAFKGQPEANTVTYYAPIRRYQLMTRLELLPDEANHPRAHDYYFRLEIGALQRLQNPIPSNRLRRITFIHTTFERLLTATDVRELYRQDDPFETLWKALRENRLRPLCNRLVRDWPVDIALRARDGNVGIYCVEEDAAKEVRSIQPPPSWTLLNLSTRDILANLDACLRQIATTLIDLGGSIDSLPASELSFGMPFAD
jgi:hypothetical protein